MDTIVPRKSKKNKYILVGSALFLVLTVLVYFRMTKKRTLEVQKTELSIKEVSVGFFEDFMVFQAKVEPLNSMLLNVIEGGSIQEIFVENGDFVEKGQPLARLYNPNTELSFMNQETALIEQMNNLNKAKLDLRTQELNLAKDLISIEHDFLDAKNLYDLNQKLFEQEILSKNEWETTKENFRYQTERKNIIQQSVQKEKQANQILIAQINQSQVIMQKSLQILRENKKNFLVVAPLSGRLSSFEPVLGKNYTAGETIGKIDVMKGYKLMADVDEFYLEKVSEGQKANIEHQGKMISVQVSKVIPEVKNGRFQVELQFENNQDLDLRQGLSFGVRLLLSEKKQTVLIPKGSFSQETAGKWIFVVNGNLAERRNITLGRENPLYYEVISGLKPNEKVITSGYQDYSEVEILSLN